MATWRRLTMVPKQPFVHNIKLAIFDKLPSFLTICYTLIAAICALFVLFYITRPEDYSHEFEELNLEEIFAREFEEVIPSQDQDHNMQRNLKSHSLRDSDTNPRNGSWRNTCLGQNRIGEAMTHQMSRKLSNASQYSSFSSSSLSSLSTLSTEEEQEAADCLRIRQPIELEQEGHPQYSHPSPSASISASKESKLTSSSIRSQFHTPNPIPTHVRQLRTPGSEDPFTIDRLSGVRVTLRPSKLRPGSFVLRRRPQSTIIPGVDTTDLYDGPFMVKQVYATTVQLNFPVKSKASPIVSRNDIKLYNGDIPEETEELKEGWYVVNRVRGRRVYRLADGRMQNQVKIAWEGWPSEDDTWQLERTIVGKDLEIYDEHQKEWVLLGRAR